MFLIALEWFIIALFLAFVWTQVFKPLLRGTLLFPLFRRQGALEEKLAEVRQDQLEGKIEQQIKKENQ